MLRGNEKKNLFLDDKDKHKFIETLLLKKIETGFLIYAYCLMDNHVHLLMGEGREQLATTMKRINTSYVCYFNKKYQRVGHLFQDRFKSEPIEDERHLMAAVRYIHNNPVKAGIVKEPSQYQWSSYSYYFSLNDTPEIDTDLVLGLFSNDRKHAIKLFADFCNKTDDDIFMDCDECNIDLTSESDAAHFIIQYLRDKGYTLERQDWRQNKELVEELVCELRKRSKLSIRQIAAALGLNRGMVHRFAPKLISPPAKGTVTRPQV